MSEQTRTWPQVRDRLVNELNELGDAEFLQVVGQPRGEPQRGLFGRKKPPDACYVQFKRFEELLQGEVSGASSFGGPVHLSDAEVTSVLAQGWRLPDDRPGDDYAFPNFWFHTTEAPDLADMAAAALRSCGVHPAELTWERGS